MEEEDKTPAKPVKSKDELAVERVVQMLKRLPNGNSLANKVKSALTN